MTFFQSRRHPEVPGIAVSLGRMLKQTPGTAPHIFPYSVAVPLLTAPRRRSIVRHRGSESYRHARTTDGTSQHAGKAQPCRAHRRRLVPRFRGLGPGGELPREEFLALRPEFRWRRAGLRHAGRARRASRIASPPPKAASGIRRSRSRSFDKVRQVAFRPWGEEYQPRRYCAARAFVSDGTRPPVKHTVYYSIIEDGGFIGFSWGVEWCVVGLDRGWGYAPNCKMALP